MNKKVVAVIIGLAVFVGVGFLLSKLNFQGKSSITINNTTTVTYTGGQFYEELQEKIKSFYDIANAGDLSKMKASEIKSEADKSLAVVNDIEKFVSSIDNFKAAQGIDELKAVLAKWVTTHKGIFEKKYAELALLIGEDGKVTTVAEADRANSIIRSIDQEGNASADELNKALDKFYAANNPGQ